MQSKLYPGYVFVKMVMNDNTWYIVRNTRGCTGIVGPETKPEPLTEAEVAKMGVETTVDLEVEYKVGDTVEITAGPMEGSVGTVDEIDIRGLVINRAAHSCSLYGEQIALTPLEFEILWYLASNQGRVVPSEELFEAVWQEKYFKSNNTVMSHIGRLRDKLHEPPKQPKFIKTVWGIGYEIE